MTYKMLSDQLEIPLKEDLIKTKLSQIERIRSKTNIPNELYNSKEEKKTKLKRSLKFSVNPKIERKKCKKNIKRNLSFREYKR